MSRNIKDINKSVTRSEDIPEYDAVDMVALKSALDKLVEITNKRKEALKVLEFLKIPVGQSGNIDLVELVDILMDDEKFSVIVKKLKNKAFW